MTPSVLRISDDVTALLRCPACGGPLRHEGDSFTCAACGTTYPVVNGIPVLIDEAHSLFSLADYVSGQQAIYKESLKSSRLGGLIKRLPTLSHNVNAGTNYRRLGELLLQEHDQPRVLVIGGRIAGAGMDALLRQERIEFVETDVSFGPRVMLICDAHHAPFEDASFDAVIAQAVLEHVLDPQQVVAELYRVLKPGGLIYAETPFMQQVHGGGYDFTRFTYLGHRRLLRRFSEIDSGAASGPGMALAWAWQYFLLSFFSGKRARAAAALFARLTGFWLKYFDRWLVKRPPALDAASSYYFLGRKQDHPLPDRDLIPLYWRNKP